MLAKILVASTLLFTYCNGVTLVFTAETKQSLIPDRDLGLKVMDKELSAQQRIDSAMFAFRNLNKFLSSSWEKHEEVMNEFKQLHPDIHQKFNDFNKAFNQTLAKMSQPAQDFFEFFLDRERGIYAEITPDETFAKFICDIAPKWNELKIRTKFEIKHKFPKLYKTLENHWLQQNACKMATSTGSTIEEDFEFA